MYVRQDTKLAEELRRNRYTRSSQNTPSIAPFLKYGTHRRVNCGCLRKEKCTCRNYSALAYPKTLKKSARSASSPAALMHPATGDQQSPHRLPELARTTHRQDRRRTWLSSEDRKTAPPPLQCRRDRRARRSPPHRTQTTPYRAGTLEDHRIIALVAKNPPGKLLTEPDGVLGAEDETKAAYWTLDTLAESAWEIGIEIGRSQVRRILLREGVRWRNTRPWAQSSDPEFAPKGRGSSNSTPTRRRTPQWSAWTSSALLLRVPFLRLRDGRRTDTASKRLWNTALRPRQGVGLWRSASGGRQVAKTFTSRSRNSKGYLKLLGRR